MPNCPHCCNACCEHPPVVEVQNPPPESAPIPFDAASWDDGLCVVS